MVERSFGAQFMVPMAISLAFGVIFATFITLILVPTSYLILNDFRRYTRLLFGRDEGNDTARTTGRLLDPARPAPAGAAAEPLTP